MALWYITPLLLATIALADYYIDNANTSVIYAMPASQSGHGWQTFSVSTQSLVLRLSNSTGNFSITLDASHCYDENYALGVCGTPDDCFIQMSFIGSGITMFVFNAGFSGMTASFSIDGGTAVSSTIQAPPPPTYQVSNVSLYDIQGLPTGNHTMKMTLLDWDGVATSMKFDYARINETFVASPANSSTPATSVSISQGSSQTPTSTPAGNPAASHNVNIGSIIGSTLGGLALFAVLVIGFIYLRKRKAPPRAILTPESTFQVHPFASEFGNATPPPMAHAHESSLSSQHQEATPSIPPLTRSTILRDALLAGNHTASRQDQSARSVRSVESFAAFQPLGGWQSPHSVNILHSNPSHVGDAGPSVSDPEVASRYHLSLDQAEVVERLRLDNVPLEAISRVIEGYVSSNLSGSETSDRKLRRERHGSVAPPPSYQTRDG